MKEKAVILEREWQERNLRTIVVFSLSSPFTRLYESKAWEDQSVKRTKHLGVFWHSQFQNVVILSAMYSDPLLLRHPLPLRQKKKKKPSCLQTTCLLFQSIKPCRFPGTASSSYHLIFTSPIEKHLIIWLNVDQDCFWGGNYKFVWLFLHHPLSGCYLIAYPKFKLHLYKKWPLKIFWWHQIMM